MVTVAKATPHPDDIILWPDHTYCYRHELAHYTHKSDDYEVLHCGTERWSDFLSIN